MIFSRAAAATLAAILLLLGSPMAMAQTGTRARPITIAGGPEGSAEAAIADRLASAMQQRLRLTARTAATDGSLENLGLLEAGTAQLAVVALPVAAAAVEGTLPQAPGRRFEHARMMLPLAPLPLLFSARADSPVSALQDIDTRVLGIGPHDGALAAVMPRLARDIGLTGRFRAAEPQDLAAQLQSRQLDAVAWLQPIPGEPATGLAGMRYFGLSVGEIQLLLDGMPGTASVHIPAEDLPGRETGLNTVGLWIALMARDDLAEDTAERVLELVLEDRARLVPFGTVSAENGYASKGVPFHAAAVRTLRVRGVGVESP